MSAKPPKEPKAPKPPKEPKAPKPPKEPKAKIVKRTRGQLAVEAVAGASLVTIETGPAHGYDPRTLGARCDLCPLRREQTRYQDDGSVGRWAPVPPEHNAGANVLIVGEAPGRDEEATGRPFVGRSGMFLERVLATGFNVARTSMSYTNVLMCRPPNNDLDGFLYRLGKENREIEEENEQRRVAGLPPRPLIPSPVACCWPRLFTELQRYTKVIALGGISARYVADARGGIMGERGAYREVTLLTERGPHKLAVVPGLHPAFVLRSPKWGAIFWWDLVRASRWFTGTIQWRPPTIIRNPSPRDLESFLWSKQRFFAWDVETDAKESLNANLRCIGVGTADTVMIVHTLGIDGRTLFYPPEVLGVLADVFRRWLTDATIAKVGHNSIGYDTIVMLMKLGIWVKNQLDTMLFHKHHSSEHPHNLEFVTTTMLDNPKWKTDREGKKKATEAETDLELGTYCLSAGVTVRLADGSTLPIEQMVRQRHPGPVLSVTADGTLVSRPVTGWHDTRREGQAWLAVRTSAMERTRTQRGLILTPDHRVYTERGELRADELRVGDRVITPEPAFAPAVAAALLGSLLGDASLTRSPSARDADAVGVAGWVCSHTRGPLAEYKRTFLTAVLGGVTEVPAQAKIIKGVATRTEAAMVLRINSHTTLGAWYPTLYPEGGKKRLPLSVLGALGPRGLAWWFMDDGCRQRGGERQSISGESIVIATCGFPREDVEATATWLSARYGHVGAAKDNTLRFSHRAAMAFCTEIAPCVPPTLRYKFPFAGEHPSFDPYVPTAPGAQEQAGRATITSIAPYEHPRKDTGYGRYRATHRYCLTVAGTDNFFAADTLVHNCSYDVAATAAVFPELHASVKARGQLEVCRKDHRLLLAGAEMHINGMYVLQDKRRAWERKLRKTFATMEATIREILGEPKLNVLSTMQLADILFKKSKIVPLTFTARGAAALDDDAIRAMIVSSTTPRSAARDAERRARIERQSPPDLIDALLALRRARRAQKYLGTYIVRLRPAIESCEDDYQWEDEDDDVDTRVERRKSRDLKPGVVLADGRVHPTWNVLPTSGRYNSSGPNLQNIPSRLKDIFGANPGNVLVGVDADQLENRVASARWGEERYLQVFRRAKLPGIKPWEADPHIETMRMVFGEERVAAMDGQPNEKAPKGSKSFKRGRDLGKRVAYASAYGANSKTVWDVITSAEDDDDNLIYADLPLAEVVAMHTNWLKNCAAYPAGWQAEVAAWLAQGYLTEPIWGRRRDFLDSTRDQPDRNELCNFPIQGSGIAIVNDALFELLDEVPHQRFGPGTGLVQHGHDALIFEVPAAFATEMMRLQNGAMNRRYACYDVDFSGESAAGLTWKDT